MFFWRARDDTDPSAGSTKKNHCTDHAKPIFCSGNPKLDDAEKHIACIYFEYLSSGYD